MMKEEKAAIVEVLALLEAARLAANMLPKDMRAGRLQRQVLAPEIARLRAARDAAYRGEDVLMAPVMAGCCRSLYGVLRVAEEAQEDEDVA